MVNPIRDRIRNNKGRLRRMSADYLCYGERLEDLEEEIAARPDRGTLGVVQMLKRQLIVLRKSVWLMRELVQAIEKRESTLVTKVPRLYLRDVYDHTIKLMDTLESLRDISSSLVDIYLSSISTRQNMAMKTLTLIATIFMPLTFIAGLYGMSFVNMPEIGMLLYFKRSG